MDVPNAGKYTVKGIIKFEGRQTEVKELRFGVGEGNGLLPLWALLLGGAALGLAGLGGFAGLAKRRRR